MTTEQAFAALERIIRVAAQDQFSEELLQNARRALTTLRAQSESRKRLVWAVRAWREIYSTWGVPTEDDRIWLRRAQAQLEITRVAFNIIAAPVQIFDSTRGQSGYYISGQEFEELQRAVEAYKTLCEQEDAHSMQSV